MNKRGNGKEFRREAGENSEWQGTVEMGRTREGNIAGEIDR